MTASPALRIRVLGGLAVEGFDVAALGSRKARTLLKLLALARGRPVPVDRIADLLWAGRLPSRPADQVGVLVSRLRRVLGSNRILREDGAYRLVFDWLDLVELEERVTQAAAALAAGRVGAARAAAVAALRLAPGSLPAEPDEAWSAAERQTVVGMIGRAHHIAAQGAMRAGDLPAAAAAAEAALLADPYDEVALRLSMSAHVAAGRPASALAVYVRVRERLVEDLGVGPTAETEALHDAIVLGGAAHAGPGPVTSPVDRGDASCVGRDGELRRLELAFERVVAGGSWAVAVTGEAGIGKSTVVDAWVRTLRGSGAAVLGGQCDELGRNLPLQPIIDAVSAHLASLPPDDAAAALGPDAPIVGALLSPVTAPAAATAVADPEAHRIRLWSSLASVLGRLSPDGPMVLVIEDLHLSTSSTPSWLAFALRRLGRLLVVTTSRPGGLRVAGAEMLEVGPLRLEAVKELCPDRDAEELLARSGGNPLLLLAIAEAKDGQVPATVRDMVHAQVASLGAATDAVQTAAVLGADVDLDLVAGALGRPAISVLADLEKAVAVSLLAERGSGLTFRHDLLRLAVEEGTGGPRRALVHREAARILASRPSPDPLAVAVHARLGGDLALASRAFREAADRAAARYELETALDHASSAIAAEPSAPALIGRARLRIVALEHDGAAEDAARAIELGGGSAAFEIAAWVAYYQRRYDDARRLADEGVVRASDDAALRTSSLAVAGRTRHASGDLAGALARFEVDRADAPPAVRHVTDVWLAHARVHQGRPAEAVALLEAALVDPEQVAHPWASLHGGFALIMALGQLGRVSDALVACDDHDAAVARAGQFGVRFVAVAANVRAWILRGTAQLEQADEANHRALEATAGPDGCPSSEPFAEGHYVALLDLVDGRLSVEDHDGAEAGVTRLDPVDTWNGTMAWHQRQRLDLLRARLALARGDADGAAELASAVVQDATARGSHRYRWLATAWLALAGGEGDLERIGAAVDGLGSSAAMEGWRLAAALGQRFGVDDWQREAERRAAALVVAAGPDADALRRAVADTFA